MPCARENDHAGDQLALHRDDFARFFEPDPLRLDCPVTHFAALGALRAGLRLPLGVVQVRDARAVSNGNHALWGQSYRKRCVAL